MKVETLADGTPRPAAQNVSSPIIKMMRGRRRGSAACLTVVLLAFALLGGSSAVAGPTWWHPPQRLTWYWQLQGKLDTSVPVSAYDVDAFETSAAEVAALHAQGKHVVCYVDVGTAESFRADYGSFPRSVLGHSNGWPGEKWLDIRQLSVIEPIMSARFRMCQEKGFDAVEPDNIEAFSNKSGFPITAQQQLSFNEWVAEEVHSLGMAVLQKNDAEQTSQLSSYFDGALTEQCNEYRECAEFEPYLSAGKPVLDAEYKSADKRFCAGDEAAGIVGARFNLALNGKRFEPCLPPSN